MAPFSNRQFTIQIQSVRRTRPSISCQFQIPFSQLSASFRAMNQSGLKLLDVQGLGDQPSLPISEPEKETIHASKPTKNPESKMKTNNKSKETSNQNKKDNPRRRQRRK